MLFSVCKSCFWLMRHNTTSKLSFFSPNIYFKIILHVASFPPKNMFFFNSDAIFVIIITIIFFFLAVLAFIISWQPSSSVKCFSYSFHFVVWPLFSLYFPCSIYLWNECYIPNSYSCYCTLFCSVRLFIFIL